MTRAAIIVPMAFGCASSMASQQDCAVTSIGVGNISKPSLVFDISNYYSILLNSDRLIGRLWSRDVQYNVPFPKSAIVHIAHTSKSQHKQYIIHCRVQKYYTFCTIALFQFPINPIGQNASRSQWDLLHTTRQNTLKIAKACNNPFASVNKPG